MRLCESLNKEEFILYGPFDITLDKMPKQNEQLILINYY